MGLSKNSISTVCILGWNSIPFYSQPLTSRLQIVGSMQITMRDAQSWCLTHLTVHLTFCLTCQNRTTSQQLFYFSFGACLEPLRSTADCRFHADLLLLLSVLIVDNNKLNYLIVFWIYYFTNYFNVKSSPEIISSTIQIKLMKCLDQCNNIILLLTKNE